MSHRDDELHFRAKLARAIEYYRKPATASTFSSLLFQMVKASRGMAEAEAGQFIDALRDAADLVEHEHGVRALNEYGRGCVSSCASSRSSGTSTATSKNAQSPAMSRDVIDRGVTGLPSRSVATRLRLWSAVRRVAYSLFKAR